MPNSEARVSDETISESVSRRRVLQASAITGGLLLGGTSSVSAQGGRWKNEDGRGGAAVVSQRDFTAGAQDSFTILRRKIENGKPVLKGFNCQDGTGGEIRLVAWLFQYTGSDETRVLYTRSNNIDTDATYTWSYEGAQDCGKYKLTSYKATG